MVSREKVLEKRLDDVRNIFIALTVAILITIPITLLTIDKIKTYLLYIIIYMLTILCVYVYVYKLRKELYEEWGRDPMDYSSDFIAIMIIGIIGLILIILAAVLS